MGGEIYGRFFKEVNAVLTCGSLRMKLNQIVLLAWPAATRSAGRASRHTQAPCPPVENGLDLILDAGVQIPPIPRLPLLADDEMEFAMRAILLRTICLITLSAILAPTSLLAARIDATPNRTYRITKQHGPWMIMVASLTEAPQERRREGIAAEDAANQLVYALRKRGIPAYAFRLSEVKSQRDGQPLRGSYRSQRDSISVIAGNYSNVDDRVAQRTRDFIKNLTLDDLHLNEWKGSAAFRPTPGQPGPFSGAFLTLNPLLTQEEIARTKRDPLLLRLNGNGEYSIVKNNGKYTLTVATFKGKSRTGIGESNYQKALQLLKVDSTLDQAAEKAWKVARMLREGMFQGNQQGRTFDAYVFHDKYQSMVTIGSFDSPQDPRIPAIAQIFRAKQHTGTNGKAFATGESIVIPGRNPETVIFDPVPTLIEVPKIR